MDAAAYQTLSPRELECLRLVAEGLTSKQIAARLSLTPDTVDGYIKTAMRKLGVGDRRAAARLVVTREGTLPQWLGEPAGGGGETGAPPAPRVPETDAGRKWFPLPLRRPGEVNNELGIASRLLWIPILAIGLAIGFGMLTSGLKVVADLAWPNRTSRPN